FSLKMNSSPRNMTRKMKTMLGIKTNEALRIFRLKKAAEMLSQGKLAGNVAVAAGFSSHSYFAQCFKAQYGCVPSNYADKKE
ncbi:MAG: helix-turn-helix domain-containing protein, partial [Psychrosphaera sp.]|nr:helix-turn-helix domain-containing protein [Psychrosphaera sp.]